ncbi:MAG: hypothetical protein ACRC7N_05920 [Clostridium sp.]
MKKYLSKALFFQWFYIGKWLLGILSLLWGIVIYSTLMDSIIFAGVEVSAFASNNILFNVEMINILLVVIIFAIYLFNKGVNKRNKYSFLFSGPFNKRKVYINDLVALFGSLFGLILIFLYLSICVSIKFSNELLLINGYFEGVMSVAFAILLIGSTFIVYLVLFDFLFSNIILTGLAVIMVPVAILFNIMNMTESIGAIVGYNRIVINIINEIMFVITQGIESILFGPNYNYYGILSTRGYFIVGIITLISCIIIGLIIIEILSRKIKIEKTNKLFTFPWVEKGIVILISLSFAQFIFIMLYSFANYTVIFGEGQGYILSVIPSIIAYVVSYKLIKYIIKLVA